METEEKNSDNRIKIGYVKRIGHFFMRKPTTKFNWRKFPSARWHYLISACFILFTLWSPILFTQCKSLVSFTNDTGVIGDTIGGIMSPWINLLAAFLIFVSFKAQIQANKIQQKALKKDERRNRMRDNYNTLSTLIRDIQKQFADIGGEKRLIEFAKELQNKTNIYLSNPDNLKAKNDLNTLFDNDAFFSDYGVFFDFFELAFNKLKKEMFYENDSELLDVKIKIFYYQKLFDGISVLAGVGRMLNNELFSTSPQRPNFFITMESISIFCSNRWDHY